MQSFTTRFSGEIQRDYNAILSKSEDSYNEHFFDKCVEIFVIQREQPVGFIPHLLSFLNFENVARLLL